MEPEKLLEYIEQGLDSISFEPGQRIPLVNSLRQVLVERDSSQPVDMVVLKDHSVADVLGFARR